jgi:hypothetical protein
MPGRKGASFSDRETHEGESVAVIDVPRMPIGMQPTRHAIRAQNASSLIDRSTPRRVPSLAGRLDTARGHSALKPARMLGFRGGVERREAIQRAQRPMSNAPIAALAGTQPSYRTRLNIALLID